MVESEIWIQYPAFDPGPAFLLVSILCLLIILASWWLWLAQRQNYHLMALLATISLGPLTVAAAIDRFQLEDFEKGEDTLKLHGDGIRFQNSEMSSILESRASHYTVAITGEENEKVQLNLVTGTGPSFRILDASLATDSPEGISRVIDQHLKLDLPVILNGFVLDLKEKELVRTKYNPYQKARRNAWTKQPIRFADFQFPSTRQNLKESTLILEVPQSRSSFSYPAFYWFLICLFLTFLYLAVQSFREKGNEGFRQPTLWLSMVMMPILWWLMPESNSGPIVVRLNSNRIQISANSRVQSLNLDAIEFLQCDMPGSGIVAYRENPEAILWTELAQLFPAGPLVTEQQPDTAELAPLAFRSSKAALRIYLEAVSIDTGTLSNTERMILCDALGRLSWQAKKDW